MDSITKEVQLEDLIASRPESLEYLMKKGICGIHCADLNQKSFEKMAKDKGFTDSEINQIVIELNQLLVGSVIQKTS